MYMTLKSNMDTQHDGHWKGWIPLNYGYFDAILGVYVRFQGVTLPPKLRLIPKIAISERRYI